MLRDVICIEVIYFMLVNIIPFNIYVDIIF